MEQAANWLSDHAFEPLPADSATNYGAGVYAHACGLLGAANAMVFKWAENARKY